MAGHEPYVVLAPLVLKRPASLPAVLGGRGRLGFGNTAGTEAGRFKRDRTLGAIVDIGRIPRMELVGGDPLPEATAGADEISLAEARGRLERRFYRFAEIEWQTLEEGLVRAKATGRPLHVILLFGSLTSESC